MNWERQGSIYRGFQAESEAAIRKHQAGQLDKPGLDQALGEADKTLTEGLQALRLEGQAIPKVRHVYCEGCDTKFTTRALSNLCPTCRERKVQPKATWQNQVDPRVVNINGEDVIARSVVDEY